jgi:hypothetical protein
VFIFESVMQFKTKWLILILLVISITIIHYLSIHSPGFISGYNLYVFYPFQAFRSLMLDWVPLSVGDVLYIAGGVGLLVTLIRWIYFITRFRNSKLKLAKSVLSLVNIFLFSYLFFIIGWGANYYKISLRQYWQLPYLVTKDTRTMVTFNNMLVNQLNLYAPHYHSLPFSEINKRSINYYAIYTDCKLKNKGLYIKPTLFSYFMERVGIDGFYNPFTGEGQVSDRVPAFIQPFVLCHEMAHQAGIAAEDDANLMAYALGTLANDSTFRYSAYLNIWLYAKNRLYRRDSAAELNIEARLNKLTMAHIDTLEQISRKYQNDAAVYTNKIYDNYLKMQDQKDGVRSYSSVAYTAWLLEMKRGIEQDLIIKIP